MGGSLAFVRARSPHDCCTLKGFDWDRNLTKATKTLSGILSRLALSISVMGSRSLLVELDGSALPSCRYFKATCNELARLRSRLRHLPDGRRPSLIICE